MMTAVTPGLAAQVSQRIDTEPRTVTLSVQGKKWVNLLQLIQWSSQHSQGCWCSGICRWRRLDSIHPFKSKAHHPEHSMLFIFDFCRSFLSIICVDKRILFCVHCSQLGILDWLELGLWLFGHQLTKAWVLIRCFRSKEVFFFWMFIGFHWFDDQILISFKEVWRNRR